MRRLLLVVVTALALAGASATEAAAVNAPTSGIAATPSGQGYWLVGRDGGVFSHGDAGFFGSLGGQAINAPIVGMAVAPGGNGYWLVGADGGVFAFGPGAGFFGSMAGQALNAPIVAIAAAPNGQGYWLVGADGGVFAFGPGAGFFGSLGGQALNAPVVGAAAAPGSNGYWLAGADGGLFTFGPGAGFFGSAAGQPLRAPVAGIAAAPGGDGYWLVAGDGGVFAFGPGAGFFGSPADGPIVSRIVGIARTANGGGYWLADVAGGVYSYGNAPVLQQPPPRPRPQAPKPPAPPPQPQSAPPQPLTPACQTQVKVKARAVWSPCLRAISGGGYRSEVAIKVAGIDFAPLNGKDITINANGRIRSDDARISFTATGPLLPSVLPEGRLTVRDGGPIDITLVGPQHLDLPVGKLLKLGGLPLVDAAGIELDWTDEGAKLKVAVSIGGDFTTVLPPIGIDNDGGGTTIKRGFGVEIELSTKNETGLMIDRIKGTVAAGKVFNALEVEELSIEYDAVNKVWSGGATIVPFGGPLIKHGLPKVKAEVGVTIEPLGFGRLALSVSKINKPMGSFVFLQSLGGEIIKVPQPWTIRGEGSISLGPEIELPFLGARRAAEAEGSLEWSYPATVKTKAKIKLVGFEVASGSINADLAAARGDLSGKLNLAIRSNGFVGEMSGWLQEGQFALTGKASVRIAGHSVGGGEAFISDRGLGACRDGFGPDYGFTVNFRKSGLDAIDVMGIGCDFNGLERKGRPRQASTATQRFEVSQGSRGVLVRVRAAAGPPSVVLRGGGQEFPLAPGVGFLELPQLTALRNDETGELFIVLNPPVSGTWTIDPLPGALPLLGIDTAEALPPPALRGRLTRVSRGRIDLRWSTNAVRGQRLAFVERGPNGLVRPLLRTTDGNGRLRFRPAPGPAGVRTIVGAVELNGTLRELRDVATIRLGAPVRPRRPARVRLRRSGSSIGVTWPRVGGAGGYLVSVRLRDGRRFERFAFDDRRVVLTGVRRGTRGRVAVRAFTPSAIFSRPRTGTLGRR